MKIALCLWGHFRSFLTCWPSLERNIIKPYQPDVFASAWGDSMGVYLPSADTPNITTHPGYNLRSPSVTSDFLKRMIDCVNPIDLHLDHFFLKDPIFDAMLTNLKDYHDYDHAHRPKGTLSLNYIRHISVKLKELHELKHNFKYDRVIIARWDLHYYGPIDIFSYDPNILICPEPGGRGNGGWGYDNPGDVWSVASSDIIDIYGDQFIGIGELVNLGKMTLQTHQWQKNWLEYKNVTWENRPEIELKCVR